MRVKAIRPFNDKVGKVLRNPKDAKTCEFDCTPERYAELKKGGYVVKVEVAEKPEEKK